jgi:hypothetical protein
MARLLSALALLSVAAPLSAGPLHHHPRHESHRHEWMKHHHHEAATEPVLGLSPGLCHERNDGGGTSSGGSTQSSGGSSQSADPTPAAVQTPPQVPEPSALLLAGITAGLWGCRRLLTSRSA